MAINWSDPNALVSRHFSVRNALWLPTWSRMAAEGDGLTPDAQNALIFLFEKMDLVADFLGQPIHVHVAFRPQIYNVQIGGATNSCHIARTDGGVLLAAVDFDARDNTEDSPGESCRAIRERLIPMLSTWHLRMEINGDTAPWIHLDTRPVLPGGNRVFLP